MGSPDANGVPAKAMGFALYRVAVGVPGGADDSDVVFRFELSDVRRQGTLTDYTGELLASTVVRITDRISGPGANESATVTDVQFQVTVPCVATGGAASEGATCTVATSFDAVTPGAIPEGKRSIWELDGVRVDDGGPDEDANTPADNSLFAVQGVFAPDMARAFGQR